MVARAGFLIAVALSCRLLFAAFPLIEESVGERDQDDAALEDIVLPVDLIHASTNELGAIPFWSLTTARKWIELREIHSQAEWTWEMFADSLGLERFQLERLREMATLERSFRERVLARITLEGDDQDDLTGVSAKLRARQEIRRRSRVEILAARRANDPQLIDDLHVTVCGHAKGTGLKYTAGTYQLDWGLGLLSSRGFGSARAFTSMESMRPEIGTGISASIPSSEFSWRRGVVVEYEHRIRLTAGVNAREWNAQVEDDVAALTGSLRTEGDALAYRDKLDERSGFFGTQFEHAGFEGGALFEASSYDPKLARGKKAMEGSLYAGFEKWGTSVRTEGVRSDGRSAISGALSRGTDRLAWTLYSLYAEEGYSPLRGQGWRGYGETPQDVWRRGIRAGWWGRALRAYAEVRDETEGDASRGEAEVRWYYDWNSSGQLHLRAMAGLRENGIGDPQRSYQRLRVEAKWDRDLPLTARAEIRDSRDSGGDNARRGSYMFLQAESRERAVRLGFRVTQFDLSTLDGPALVYENDLIGAYPILFLSGGGTRAAGWCAIKEGSLRFALKTAWQRRDGAGSEYEFGVEATFVR